MRPLKQLTKLGAWAGLAVLAFALAAVWAPSAPARADGDTVALSLSNGPTFTYSKSPTPIFSALITTAPQSYSNRGVTVVFAIDGGGTGNTYYIDGTWNIGASTIAVNFDTHNEDTNGTTFAPGTHTVVATFTNPVTNTTTTSNSITFTIQLEPVNLSCVLGNPNDYNPQQSAGTPTLVTFSATDTSYGNKVSVDWTQGTATITFAGPITQTYSNVQLTNNSNQGQVTITTPTTPGKYSIGCTFTDTSLYTFVAQTTGGSPYTLSQNQRVTIKLYTNPTTIVANQSFHLYIVFQGVSGLPTPTGTFSIDIGDGSTNYWDNGLKIPAGGTEILNSGGLANLYSGDKINISYSGDAYYGGTTATFTMTNPAIPGGSGNGQGSSFGSGNGSATATPEATETTTITAGTPTATATPIKIASGKSNAASVSGWLAWLLGGLGLLVVIGGGVGAYVFFARRRMNTAQRIASMSGPTPEPVSHQNYWGQEPQTQSWQSQQTQQWPPRQPSRPPTGWQ